ncbi:undecaprenyl-diphosphate phosphatase BcrC [Paradesulfitobacterium aromaticivorans]
MNVFDLAGYHLINHLAGQVALVDKLMAFGAQYALELYALLFLIAWFVLPSSDTNHRHALMVMGFSGIFALIINVLIAQVWFRPRPFVTLPQGSFHQLIPHAHDSSFPSDHTAGSFAFAAGSWRKSERWVSLSFTFLAVFVAVARIYTGVHWPTDVLAGVVVGLFSARITWALNRFFKPLTNLGLRIFHYGQYSKKLVIGKEVPR